MPDWMNDKFLKNFNSFCSDLDTYLKSEFGYKNNIVVRGLGPTLEAERKLFWLYIRYYIDVPFGKETIVLGTISFRDNRNSHGTRLLAYLSSISEKYKYRFICIENVGEFSRAFALKHGFRLYNPVGTYSENAIIEVEELRDQLDTISRSTGEILAIK